MTIHIDVVNGMPGSQYTKNLAGWTSSFQKFTDLVTGIWGLEPAKLTYRRNPREADPLHWWLVANNTSDVQGAGGYHEEHPGGLPYARVFVGDAIRMGYSPTVDMTHELGEMLVDPWPDSKPRLWDDGHGLAYLVEIGDPVEADEFGFEIDGVLCTDFVIPMYYMPGSAGPWDHQGHLQGPCPDLTSGGYISWQVIASGQWKQAFARLWDGSQSRRSLRFGRSARAARTRSGG